MKIAQIYCTTGEVIADLSLTGEEPKLFDQVETASQAILGESRNGFLPITETRSFDGWRANGASLIVGPLLSISSVTIDGTAVTDYTAHPRQRAWLNGPYTWLERLGGWGSATSVIQIAGTWGKYDRQADLGITATQTAEAATIVVANGGLVSPGMVILLGSEQQLVTGRGDPSLAVSQLASAVDVSTEIVPVDDGTEFHVGEYLTVGLEDLLVLKILGYQLVVKRGCNGTAIAEHVQDDPIYVYRTYAVTRGVNGTIAAAHEASPIARVLPPKDVNYLATQIAALIRQKAKTGYGGRSGNADQGQSFFINEFPRMQIEGILGHYPIPYE